MMGNDQMMRMLTPEVVQQLMDPSTIEALGRMQQLWDTIQGTAGEGAGVGATGGGAAAPGPGGTLDPAGLQALMQTLTGEGGALGVPQAPVGNPEVVYAA